MRGTVPEASEARESKYKTATYHIGNSASMTPGFSGLGFFRGSEVLGCLLSDAELFKKWSGFMINVLEAALILSKWLGG